MNNESVIRIEGARQNNLKNLSVDIPIGKITVVTGVSGSGKSSLVFDTIFAEGQRRYIETFSAYTRQFLDRMDKPQVDRIVGIPPAVAIEAANPVRTSRSTVGTMTEINDYLKILYAKLSKLYCKSCGREVKPDTPDSVLEFLTQILPTEPTPLIITFRVSVPPKSSVESMKEVLASQGYNRFLSISNEEIEVIQDRVLFSPETYSRAREALEVAFLYGKGRLTVYQYDQDRTNPLNSWRFSKDLHCPDCNIHYKEPFPNLFSFNSPLGACPRCRGFGRIIDVDIERVIPDETLSLQQGAIKPWQTSSYSECQEDLESFARKRGFPLNIPWRELTEEQKQWVIEGEGRWEEGKWYGIRRFFQWLETRAYKMHIRVLLSKYRDYIMCPECKGARLQQEALLWRLPNRSHSQGLTIHQLASLSLYACREYLSNLTLSPEQEAACAPLLQQVLSRLGYLIDVGLGYLTLDRQSRTLSGGELQRINLTTALGAALVNTLFVLDEPSIGLHPRDIDRLIHILQLLRDNGNTLVIVEHDPAVIKAADHIIDMGPGPGQSGGNIVFAGPLRELYQHPTSLTAQYLRNEKKAILTSFGSSPLPGSSQGAGSAPLVASKLGVGSTLVLGPAPVKDPLLHRTTLRIEGASLHNLKNLSLSLPLHQLVVISGVSGSGKSTLLEQVLYPNLVRLLQQKGFTSLRNVIRIEGFEEIDQVLFVDQKPIGKSSRSNPVSYIGAFDSIRKLFASLPLSKEKGYTAGTFSFNSGNGRCPTCEGKGFERIEMQFLSDVYLRCPDCDGKRFKPEILEVHYLGPDGTSYSIADVLDLTVDEAIQLFNGKGEITHRLSLLKEVGLGYLTLGQGVPSLSGGEAQRLKLAGYLADAQLKRASHILFLLDEPTTGLHFEDISLLLQVFRKLLEQGHSLIVIEHNLDVIASADYLIDLGPEGGEEGGKVVAAGPPLTLLTCPESRTGQSLFKYLNPYISGAATPLTHTLLSQKSGQQIPYNREQEASSLQVAESTPPFSSLSNNSFQYSPSSPNEKTSTIKQPLPSVFTRTPAESSRTILVRGAKEHNLKNLTVSLPLDTFTVITGVSGSGKSTLAFNIVFAEGQRRYLETLNAYARQFVEVLPRPEVEEVVGVPPTVSIEQQTSRGGRKSTVATITEIYHYLRLWFTKLGTYHCPTCQVPIEPQTAESITELIFRELAPAPYIPSDTTISPQALQIYAPLVTNRKGVYRELASWVKKEGYGQVRIDGALYDVDSWPTLSRYKEHSIDLLLGIDPNVSLPEGILKTVQKGLELGKGNLKILLKDSERFFSVKRMCPSCGTSFPEPDPRLFSFNSKHGWCPRCFGTGLILSGFDENQTGEEIWWNEWYEGQEVPCPACKGKRLRPEALSVTFQGLSIADVTALSVMDAYKFFSQLHLKGRSLEIGKEILPELLSRLSFLEEVGLSYLSLDRSAPSLSGGESRRVRLAAQLGSNLRGVCYILDEPTIGLHSRDNEQLLRTLKKLKSKGNTLLVVEHDEQTIREADHIIDLGPGGGVKGGEILAEGNLEALMQNKKSLTGTYLLHPLFHPLRRNRRPVTLETPRLWVRGATLHNLKEIDVGFPLGRFVVVSGVSGSGKSTLVREVLYTSLIRLLHRSHHENNQSEKNAEAVGCKTLEGWEQIGRVLEVDQTPVGRTPRSCPATYIGFWDSIRKLYAELPESRVRGYTPSRFS
ncbi:MAG: hypothetical protein SNJ78_09130, partial [Spirochaetales bacterium]